MDMLQGELFFLLVALLMESDIIALRKLHILEVNNARNKDFCFDEIFQYV